MPTEKTEEGPSLAARLRERIPTIGLIVKMPGPAVIETAGHAGFDLVVIDTEHGAGDAEHLENHLRAADGVGVDTLVRVGANSPLDILRALDAGATGVIVPHVDTVADAEAAVAAAHYPPTGARGLATSTRAGGHGVLPLTEHLRRALRDTVVVAQIEDKRAVPEVGSIARTPHLNAVWPGPSDLSMSLGHPGDMDHPDVAEAVDAIIEQVNGAGMAALCVLAGHEDQTQYWHDRGAGLILFAAPTLFGSRLKQVATEARAITWTRPVSA